MARSTKISRLTIAHTWDGEPLPPSEHVHVLLRSSSRHLTVGIDAPFHDDPPPPERVGATEGLWDHEVVEVFLAGTDPGAPVVYTEIELSPHGHHLVLQLAGVRRRVATGLPLQFRARRTGSRWQGVARIDRKLLPPPPWRGNAFAIHGPKVERHLLAAIPLPGPVPDFHQPHRFPSLLWS